MPRAAFVKRALVQAGQAIAAEANVISAESQSLLNNAAKPSRAFSSLAARGTRNGIVSIGKQLFEARATATSLGSKCRCSCGRVMCMGNHFHTSVGHAQAEAALADERPHAPSLTARHQEVAKHFPAAMGVDDFMARLEMALAAYGFTGDNAIGEFHATSSNSALCWYNTTLWVTVCCHCLVRW
eukprot:GHRR01032452.1.p1 GENE.GHRR01032452.1~~GHRR01032452.1.p1  ORF type:complete len:184 (-),score=53.60 GHRR01032452.1:218-769(-)